MNQPTEQAGKKFEDLYPNGEGWKPDGKTWKSDRWTYTETPQSEYEMTTVAGKPEPYLKNLWGNEDADAYNRPRNMPTRVLVLLSEPPASQPVEPDVEGQPEAKDYLVERYANRIACHDVNENDVRLSLYRLLREHAALLTLQPEPRPITGAFKVTNEGMEELRERLDTMCDVLEEIKLDVEHECRERQKSVGEQEYRGNTVSYIYDKLELYRHQMHYVETPKNSGEPPEAMLSLLRSQIQVWRDKYLDVTDELERLRMESRSAAPASPALDRIAVALERLADYYNMTHRPN